MSGPGPRGFLLQKAEVYAKQVRMGKQEHVGGHTKESKEARPLAWRVGRRNDTKETGMA